MNAKPQHNPIDPDTALAVLMTLCRLLKTARILEMLERRAQHTPTLIDDIALNVIRTTLRALDP